MCVHVSFHSIFYVADESASSAERSRSKSNARRKHREKRRVTGIPTEVCGYVNWADDSS